MTPINWIGIGITTILIIIYVVLRIYVKRKKDEYDGLGGITKKKKPPRNHWREQSFSDFDEDENG